MRRRKLSRTAASTAVDGVDGGVGEMIAAHAIVVLEVSDHRFDGGTPFELTLDLF
jgi:hypothetical protein